MTSDQRFQVHLRGIIELLSHHLYSGPEVYLRELLQNAADAIVARCQNEPDHRGEIRFELVSSDEDVPTLLVTDNGIGLTEDEVHEFLATIGQSSKRDSLEREDFIGQFGIGLLSGFIVSNEIVAITRSAKRSGSALQWSGRADGTYSLRPVQGDYEPGTRVFLRAKPGCHEFFQRQYVEDMVAHFGSHLPFAIDVGVDNDARRINDDPPWRFGKLGSSTWRKRCLSYGQEVFGMDFLDVIPLQTQSGGIEGAAYVLPLSASASQRQRHRVYLKEMLVSERADNLLPDWAFFVRCVVNATDLRPTAARDSFYEDDTLAAARDSLGQCLRSYLVNLAQEDRNRLDRLIDVHYLPLKALAVEDDEFFRMFADWLPFETSLGQMTLGEYCERENVVRYVSSRDQFRQIAGVAAAQSMCILNAGYVYDEELIERLPELMADRKIEPVEITELAQTFEELTLKEREEVFDFIRLADVVLQPFRCGVEIRRFSPPELPTLYTTNQAADFLRSIEQSKDVADELWSGVLDQIARDPAADAASRLCLNYRNPLIQRLVQVENRSLVRRAVETLYVQALLLGHYPLKSQETRLLSDSLLGLIEQVVDADSEGE